MATIVVSFVVIVAACVALALGPLLGRGPIKGSCRPGAASGGCANADLCVLRRATGTCAKARSK